MKSLLIASVSRERLLARGPRSSTPTLALTFDDGPDPEHTPNLLKRLATFGHRATFFVIGNKADQHPELIREMAAAGHEVANHTYSHSEPRDTSPALFLDEIRRTDDLLHKLTGQLPTSAIPPKGELNWVKLRGLWQLSKTVVLWNSDPKDFRMKHKSEMTQWCADFRPKDGDILLMHDNHPYAVEAVEALSTNGILDRFSTTTIRGWLKSKSEQ